MWLGGQWNAAREVCCASNVRNTGGGALDAEDRVGVLGVADQGGKVLQAADGGGEVLQAADGGGEVLQAADGGGEFLQAADGGVSGTAGIGSVLGSADRAGALGAVD